MKTIITAMLLTIIIGAAGALDIEAVESYQLIDLLLSFQEPGAPEILEDMVIFTASSGLRRVGVAFADEGFAKVHWFRQFMIPQDPLDAPIPPGKKKPDPYKNSNILFYVHQIPDGAAEVEYRLIVNGLWMADPANPHSRRDRASGLACSFIPLPPRPDRPNPLKGPPDSLSFSFKGPPGETVSVAGSFNGWDPFMYELAEGPIGVYTINIPLPPGKYQYVFFNRGERYLDPYNPRRVWSKEGKPASEIELQ